jgi:hypothetical protein
MTIFSPELFYQCPLENVGLLDYEKRCFSRENKTSKKYFTFNGNSTAMNSISAKIIPTKKAIST